MTMFFFFLFSQNFLFVTSVLMQGNEEAITFDLIQFLNIRHCIRILENSKVSNVNSFKKFSKEQIQTVFLDKNTFVDLITRGVFTYWRIVIIIETNSLATLRDIFYLLKNAGKGAEIEKFTWLVFLKNVEDYKIQSDALDVPYDCEFIIIHTNDEFNYNLIEIYKVKEVNVSSKLGTWSKNLALKISNLSFYNRRSDLSNISVQYATFMLNENACGREKVSIACSKREIFLDMQSILKFKVEKIRKTRERSDEDDYADIYDSQAVFHSYFYRFEMFAPLLKTYLNWYIKEPVADVEPGFYKYPFAVDLWFSIYLTIIIGSLALVIIGSINRILENKSLMLHLIDDLFATLECYCSQDGGENREYSSFRIILITILLNASFIIPAYSAFITSYLAVRIPRLPFRNLEEFMRNGEYILLRNDDAPFPDTYFKFSTDPVTQVLYKKFLQAYPQDENLRKTCTGKYSIILPNIYQQNGNCSFYKMKTPITYFFLGLPLKKRSIFRNVLIHYLVRSYTSGIINKLQKKLNSIPIGAMKETNDDYSPININQLSQILLLVPIGIALGVTVFILEVLTNTNRLSKFKKSRRKKNSFFVLSDFKISEVAQ